MGNEEREKCLAWLESKENCVFDFKKEMLIYCQSDVDILRQACLKFRELLMSATGDCVRDERGKPHWTGAVDPFDSVTIASVCMNVYRTKFLEEEWRVKLAGESWASISELPKCEYYHPEDCIIPCCPTDRMES